MIAEMIDADQEHNIYFVGPAWPHSVCLHAFSYASKLLYSFILQAIFKIFMKFHLKKLCNNYWNILNIFEII